MALLHSGPVMVIQMRGSYKAFAKQGDVLRQAGRQVGGQLSQGGKVGCSLSLVF
jgi:hypothetical protein